MNIEASIAAQLYDNARKISPSLGTDTTVSAAGRASASDAGGFADAIAEAGRTVVESLHHGETAMRAAMTGQGDVQSVVEALTATELALETAVTVRNRVVEAYQELLRMPV